MCIYYKCRNIKYISKYHIVLVSGLGGCWWGWGVGLDISARVRPQKSMGRVEQSLAISGHKNAECQSRFQTHLFTRQPKPKAALQTHTVPKALWQSAKQEIQRFPSPHLRHRSRDCFPLRPLHFSWTAGACEVTVSGSACVGASSASATLCPQLSLRARKIP